MSPHTIGYVGVVLWLALQFSAGWWVRGWLTRRRLRLQRGGFVRPLASVRTKDGGQLTPATATTARISSYSLPGGVSAAWETPRALRDPSRLTERGWSTGVTAAAGANGEQPAPAAFASQPLTFKPW